MKINKLFFICYNLLILNYLCNLDRLLGAYIFGANVTLTCLNRYTFIT